jgi:glutaredoxin
MKELTLFYFNECPHCQNAFRWQEELFAEHPEFKDIPLKLINEKEQPELADQYDYWLVPTYYIGEKKLHEGVMDKALIEDSFRQSLNA